jgi:predicted DNA-binding transcriptional regulator AlpA
MLIDLESTQRAVLSTNELAKLAGISDDTLRRLHTIGKGPKRIQLSARRVGYRWSDVQEWLGQREAREAA